MNFIKARTAYFPLLLALAMVLLATAASAAEIPLDAKGLPLWEERVFSDFPVRIILADRAELNVLLERAPIASFNREQIKAVADTNFGGHLVFEPRVTEGELREIERAGFGYERLEDLEMLGRKAAERAWAEQAERGGDLFEFGERGVYHTHAQIGVILAGIADDHPNLASDYTWGNSVQGRELWGIVISDNVGVEEAEPEVRFSSTMHGDEPVGTEMLLFLADYLTDNYGQAGYDDVTYLVDNYEIHLMPLYNPDGNAAHDRENANGVDLNRNFADPAGTHGTQEIENLLFMSHANSHHFVVSTNAHTGALVMNYPWDYTYTRAPDDAALQLLALEYSTYNLPMYNGSFYHGITNGADWYVITGSLQDWSYYATDCIDITAELNNVKWPNSSVLDGLWDDNRESLMHYTKAARYGVNGLVTSAATGLPLNATITVDGIDKPVHTDPDHGDYYKLLHTGSFDITFDALGYQAQTIYGVSTTWGTPTVLDVALQPDAHDIVSGHITGAGAPVAATIVISTSPVGDYVGTWYSDAGYGYYEAELPHGTYLFEVTCDGYLSEDRIVSVSGPRTEDFLLMASVEIVLFSEDSESDLSQWSGDWALTTEEDHSPSHSITDSPGGDYNDNVSSYCAMASSLSLSGIIDPELNFWAQWEIEDNWDCVRLQISTNGGGSWSDVATNHTVPGSGQGEQPSGAPVFEGNQFSWVLNTVDLSPWNDETDLRFRFLLETDTSQRRDGFYFDDFEIKGLNVTTDAPETAPLVTSLRGNFPNPFNPKTRIEFSLAEDGPARLAIHDINGRLVRELLSGHLPSGEHAAEWNGLDADGRRVGSGVYFARLLSGGEARAMKLVLIK